MLQYLHAHSDPAHRLAHLLHAAGGVGANARLREQLVAAGAAEALEVFFPRPGLCTDNGAMIAFAGAQRLPGDRSARIIARARWPIDDLQPVSAD